MPDDGQPKAGSQQASLDGKIMDERVFWFCHFCHVHGRQANHGVLLKEYLGIPDLFKNGADG
tara:strand:+ start:112 stop:297 length:186 start_codon:yes stop_codon:yes gene_type:complete